MKRRSIGPKHEMIVQPAFIIGTNNEAGTKNLTLMPFLFLVSMLLLTACGSKEKVQTAANRMISEDAGKTAASGEKVQAAEAVGQMVEVEEALLEKRAIPVDFPFPYTMEAYTMSLVPVRGEKGQYDLRICDESGVVVQQFFCGALAEPLTFRYDDLFYDSYCDLEIFSADSRTGLLFPYDWQHVDGRILKETAIEIPLYDDFEGPNIMVREDSAACVKKTIYQVNMDRNEMVEARRWHMDKETGTLEIWDCLEQRTVFAGQTAIDEDGEPVNEEYYGYLFWNVWYWLRPFKEDSEINVWISEPWEEDEEWDEGGYELMQHILWGNDGHMTEYPDRQTLLAEYGFADREPSYEAYDERGNLSLELYVNEREETACGFIHQYRFSSDMEKVEYLYGFTIDNIQEIDWEEPDPYHMKSYDGGDGSDSVEGYEEILENRDDGKPAYFVSKGCIEWLKDGGAEEGEKDILIQIAWVYRDDGSMYCRRYRHNGYVFSSTFSTMDSYYDEAGRVVYENGYITHGSLLYYYFYEDSGRKPKFCLELDDNLGYYIPVMVKYR